ncbi:protein transport protein Sec24C isoform X1 [Xyrichtys novacula]|uniref:Protein transport protein Sec24C isoform X1 n=1 Tax=Xyrichtys novacula TaxID=13765 RepID=A0AAV1G7J1_XYRNO|nr:protein transport protein Sec24C isoform X1 [Xyrichtys novacula]
MMDNPAANQSQTPSQPWAGQNGWSPASPQAALYNPLPSFQHLNLGSPSDQRLCSEHLHQNSQGCQRDISPSRNITCHSTVQPYSADQNVQQSNPNAYVSSMVTAASHGKIIPPCSLPLTHEGTQPRKPFQMPFYSPYSPYQASPSCQPPYSHQGSLNGPQSPHQKHLPIISPSFGHCVGQIPQSPTQPLLLEDGSIRYTHNHASPTSPVQQQPQWALQQHSAETTKQVIPSAAIQDGSFTPQSPNSESRYGLDPELLPSAVKVLAEDTAEWEGKVFVSEPFSSLPPLPTTSCIVEDRGSASPRAIRSTSYCVPCEGQTALLSRLPLGALVTPLAEQNPEEKPLPEVKESECVRGCGWCGASMCPAMSWQDCGQRFYCPFCGKLSEVPWQHYQPTKGVEGVRVDKDKRSELSMGSYEILNSEKGEPAALLLAIDVSASALRGGHLEFATQQILTLLTSLNREDGEDLSDIRVGLMTYDSHIHLYDLSPALSRPHMLVITETEDLQLPVREGLLVSLKDCIDGIDSVLQLIPQFAAEGDNPQGVPMELPVKAGLAVLQALNCPGKLLIFHTAPLVEMANTNSSSGFFGSNKPKSIFQPSESVVTLAKQCVSQGCSIHLLLLSKQDVGGAWPGHIPYLTGGALYTYSHLQGELDRERFSADLKRIIESDTGYKAELRIFVSKDLRVSGCYGLFLPGSSPSLVNMATVDGFTTLAVELAHTRTVDETRGVAIQAVLSYCTQSGDKRTRVHTLTLRCSRQLQDTFRQYQAQTLLTFYCKKTGPPSVPASSSRLHQQSEKERGAAAGPEELHPPAAAAALSGAQHGHLQHLHTLLPSAAASAALSRHLQPSRLRGGAALLCGQPGAQTAVPASCTPHAAALGGHTSPSEHLGRAVQHQLLFISALRRDEAAFSGEPSVSQRPIPHLQTELSVPSCSQTVGGEAGRHLRGGSPAPPG